MRRVVAVVLVVCLTGCGLTMTRGPDPHRPPDQRPDCTQTMSAPKRDAIPAALGFFSLLVGLLFLKADDNEDVGVPLMAGGAVVTVASYISGGVGYFRVKKCRKAIADYEQRMPGYPPPSPGYPPPGYPPPGYPPAPAPVPPPVPPSR